MTENAFFCAATNFYFFNLEVFQPHKRSVRQQLLILKLNTEINAFRIIMVNYVLAESQIYK